MMETETSKDFKFVKHGIMQLKTSDEATQLDSPKPPLLNPRHYTIPKMLLHRRPMFSPVYVDVTKCLKWVFV
jgi:hypothetical protein